MQYTSAYLIQISDNFSLKDLKLYSIRDTLSRNFKVQVLYCTWWEPLIWLNCFFSSALTQRLLWERWLGARGQFNSPLFFQNLTRHLPISNECVLLQLIHHAPIRVRSVTMIGKHTQIRGYVCHQGAAATVPDQQIPDRRRVDDAVCRKFCRSGNSTPKRFLPSRALFNAWVGLLRTKSAHCYSWHKAGQQGRRK